MWPHSQLHGEFTRQRISYTQPREEVFQALTRLQPCPQSAVVLALTGIVGRQTVLRTLKLFLAHGIAFQPEGKQTYLSPKFIHHGHSLTCLECGSEIRYRDEGIERAIARLAESRRFQPTGHSLSVVGTCGKHG